MCKAPKLVIARALRARGNLAVPGWIVGQLSAKTQLPSRDCHVASLLAMTNLEALTAHIASLHGGHCPMDKSDIPGFARSKTVKKLPSRKFRREEKCERKPSGFPFASNNPPQRQNCKIMLQNFILQF